MLKDYEIFLETAEAKLKSDSITARDLSHLKQQLSAHKDFFSDLEANKAMLDSLASHCDEYSRSSLQHKLSSLMSLTVVLVDKASLHGQRLERLVKEWTECDEKFHRVHKNLLSVELNIPHQINSADSLTTIQNKLSRFKSLQLKLAEERNLVYEVVERGKVILHSVNCPSLETAISDLAEKWVALNTELTSELKRTEVLGDQLSIFERDAALLSTWLATAKMKLASFQQLTPNELEAIAAVRNKVEKVLEFRKEIENQISLKNRVLDVGNKLLLNKNYDTRGLSGRLSDFEEEWKQLEHGILDVEKFLYERQMELMPSRQALTELTAWINKIKKSLAKDAQKKVETVSDIEVMIKKYTDYKVELTSRQMPVDFVNQKILAPHPDEANVPHEKLEFAEKLGQLNKKWKDVLQNVNDRLSTLKSLHDKWEDFDLTLKRLQAWFSEQEDTIKRYKLIGHEVGVKQTLKDCKAIRNQLKVKSEEIKILQTLGNSLMEVSHDSPGCQRSVKDSLQTIQERWARLDDQVGQMELLLNDMTDQWSSYHAEMAKLNILLTQTEYSLNQYSLAGGDIGTLKSQVAKLQTLQKELNMNMKHRERFTHLSEQLKRVCEPAVQDDIQKTVTDLHARWDCLSSDLTERCYMLKQCLSQCEDLERHYGKIQNWLDMQEAMYNEIKNNRDDVLQQQASLSRLKEIQSELDNYQSQMSSLYNSTDQLTKYLSPSTISFVMSRNNALEQRMLTLRKLVTQQMSHLTDDMSQLSKFNKAFEAVQKFLSSAETVLVVEDPDRSAEEDVLKRQQKTLSELVLSFISNYSKLDAVNDLGYRLALNVFDATRLKDLNHKWQRLYEETNDRCRRMQEHLLVQQDFTEKCQTWMTFLAQTEINLAKELRGNLNDLKEQLRQCEHFESEAGNHQQVLYAIISDGMRMMRAGEVEDSEEFQKKLDLLSDQWQSVSRRVHQRRTMIEGLINQWHQFHSLSQQLKDWLIEKEENLKACEFETDSLHIIRSLVDKVKTTQHEFSLQEATYRKINEFGENLLHHTGFNEAGHVQDVLSDLRGRWLRIFGQLGDQKSRFEDVNKQWLHCEDDIEELLQWLKEIRLAIQSELPTTFDELQMELNTCRDISIDFSNSECKRQDLIMKERQLSKMIQAEDMNIIHQRIRLLNKQWEELQHQILLREQRLSEALFRWTNVGQSIQSLFHWMDDMEIKILSNRDLQVEDMLNKLEKEYKQEMERKEIEKNEIVSQGRHLIRNSSEIRASDIEQKILRLEEKWERLQAILDFRHRKLQETVLAVKQLDTSMKKLTQWLSSVEAELSGGIAYKDTNLREIQAKLEANKDLQKEIEGRSAGVSAVLNLCEVLLHDTDACPTEVEFTALQHAMKTLQRRWKNICTLSPQRRTKLEETWQLWQKFQKDCERFSDWLKQVEIEVQFFKPDIPDVRAAKDEILKYEKLQRNVHDHLTELEQINRLYCQLAKEGRTDLDGSLKVMMTELNDRWDAMQHKVTEIMKKLKHSASILEDFETTRSSLVTWLRQVELQLTDIQDINNLDFEGKMVDIRNIEDELHTRRHRMEYLDQAALYLIQKGDSQQALRVQRELDEFKALSKRILEKIITTKLRIERLLVAQGDITFDSRNKSYYSLSTEDRLHQIRNVQADTTANQQIEMTERSLKSSPESPSLKYRSDSSPSRVRLSAGQHSSSPTRWIDSSIQRSQSPSPIRSRSPAKSSASTALPTSDSRSRSPSKIHISSLPRASPRRRFSPSPQRFNQASLRDVDVTDGRASSPLYMARLDRITKIEVLLEELVDCIEDCNSKLSELETFMATRDDPEQLIQQLVECEIAVSKMTSLHRLLKTETGQEVIGDVDLQVKLIQQKWHSLKMSPTEQNFRTSQDLAQFSSDLDKMISWLDEAEALQSTQRPLPVDIDQLNLVIRQFTDFMSQIESKKPVISSINFMSKAYLIANNMTTRQLRRKLQEMNDRWDCVLLTASEMERDLQISLIQCQEFHHNIHDCVLWLDDVENKVHRCEPINSGDQQKLIEKYQILLNISEDLQSKQSKVLFLKETADKLLLNTSSPEMATARDKTHSISHRMRSLTNLLSSYISHLEKKLQILKTKQKAHLSGSTDPLLQTSLKDDNLSTELESSTEELSYTKVRPFLLMRVLRAAIPFILLLLFFLWFACLIPYCEDEFSCLHSNNLHNSFTPTLRYTDGAPPV
ncbi:Nesprin-1 [Bulinus truncatus]|nr:Nesprin-1 [Bulinus truncatus]